jgi:hypothetical protein
MGHNLGYIAIGLFIALFLILLLIPKNMLAKSLGINDTSGLGMKRMDNIGYYKALFIISGSATIVIMLFVKYVVL